MPSLGLFLTAVVALGVGALSVPVEYGCQRNNAHLYGGKLIVHPQSGYCYEFFTRVRQNYFEADHTCRFYGGHLVSITSKEIEDVLTHELRYNIRYYYLVWIGLHDRDSPTHNDGFYRWADGSQLIYQHWGTNKGPFNQRQRSDAEDCVAMDMFGLWHDYNCFEDRGFFSTVPETRLAFICQMRAVPRIKPVTAPRTTVAARVPITTEGPAPRIADPTTSKPITDSGDETALDIQARASVIDNSSRVGGSMSDIGYGRLDVDLIVDTQVETTTKTPSLPDTTTLEKETTEAANEFKTTAALLGNSASDTNDSATATVEPTGNPARQDGSSCPTFDCDTSCGTIGYKKTDGCMLCECND